MGKRAKKAAARPRFRKTTESPPAAPPTPAREWPAEVEAAWAKALARLTEDLPQASSKDEIAKWRALLTSRPPRAESTRSSEPRQRPERTSGGPRLVSADQIKRGKARYNELLDENQQRWRFQRAAAQK